MHRLQHLAVAGRRDLPGLVNVQKTMEAMALIEIDGLPFFKMMDLSMAMLVITRGIYCKDRKTYCFILFPYFLSRILRRFNRKTILRWILADIDG